MPSQQKISAVALLIAGAPLLLCHVARAEGGPPAADPVSELAARPELAPLQRIVVISLEDRGPLSAWGREAVVSTLTRAGHEVATLTTETAAGADAVRLQRYCRGFDAVAVVKISTTGDKPTVTVDVYGADGKGIVELRGPVMAPPPAPPTPRLWLVASEMTGPAFYESMGRPDLALSYQHRKTARSVFLGVGAVLVPLGLVLGILDGVATAAGNIVQGSPCVIGAATSTGYGNGQTCPQSEPSSIPWVIAGVGVVSLITGAVLTPDPMTESERRALYDARARGDGEAAGPGPLRACIRLDAAPAARGEGGSIFLSGRF